MTLLPAKVLYVVATILFIVAIFVHVEVLELVGLAFLAGGHIFES